MSECFIEATGQGQVLIPAATFPVSVPASSTLAWLSWTSLEKVGERHHVLISQTPAWELHISHTITVIYQSLWPILKETKEVIIRYPSKGIHTSESANSVQGIRSVFVSSTETQNGRIYPLVQVHELGRVVGSWSGMSSKRGEGFNSEVIESDQLARGRNWTVGKGGRISFLIQPRTPLSSALLSF